MLVIEKLLELPADVFQKAVRHTIEQGCVETLTSESTGTINGDISTAFTWGMTAEGGKYWKDVASGKSNEFREVGV